MNGTIIGAIVIAILNIAVAIYKEREKRKAAEQAAREENLRGTTAQRAPVPPAMSAMPAMPALPAASAPPAVPPAPVIPVLRAPPVQMPSAAPLKKKRPKKQRTFVDKAAAKLAIKPAAKQAVRPSSASTSASSAVSPIHPVARKLAPIIAAAAQNSIAAELRARDERMRNQRARITGGAAVAPQAGPSSAVLDVRTASLRRAILLSEVLAAPRALRPWMPVGQSGQF